MSGATTGRWSREPSIREMLADPIVQLLMRRDGVSGTLLMVMLNSVRNRLAGARRLAAAEEVRP